MIEKVAGLCIQSANTLTAVQMPKILMERMFIIGLAAGLSVKSAKKPTARVYTEDSDGQNVCDLDGSKAQREKRQEADHSVDPEHSDGHHSDGENDDILM